MTEKNSNPPAEGDEQPPPEKPAGEQPVRRGPPIEVAVEVLDARGEETAALLRKVVDSHVRESGGRDDTPWALVDAANLVGAARACHDNAQLSMDMLHCQFAIDYEDHIQVVYILLSTSKGRKLMLKANLPSDSPEIETVTGIWEAATWYEREAHDLFGVEFKGNPDLSPLLLFEGFEGHPGLKSYPFNDYEEW